MISVLSNLKDPSLFTGVAFKARNELCLNEVEWYEQLQILRN
jgi:hypothetical protein